MAALFHELPSGDSPRLLPSLLLDPLSSDHLSSSGTEACTVSLPRFPFSDCLSDRRPTTATTSVRGVLGSVGLCWVLCKGPGEGQPASGEGPQGPEKGGAGGSWATTGQKDNEEPCSSSSPSWPEGTPTQPPTRAQSAPAYHLRRPILRQRPISGKTRFERPQMNGTKHHRRRRDTAPSSVAARSAAANGGLLDCGGGSIDAASMASRTVAARRRLAAARASRTAAARSQAVAVARSRSEVACDWKRRGRLGQRRDLRLSNGCGARHRL
ncbi:hypothetical protein THAOC_29499 [Thalassiosira oceanica]|uniref:Uncharacterized protein n=1 Tax=Thalassiosira oceanica TaxID=159749 RepID=K0RR22_THAOC|nr:hypothetical protein THAOC_29499 [Thalassiosira oceanica]|eukprot:EJK51336.1 hypothetical protein THAOC_29499 [Thalassiosira oceanica]